VRATALALVAVVVLSALAGVALSGALTAAAPRADRVVYVVDGDTVHVARGGQEVIVRVIGIDAPEVPHPRKAGACYGAEATSFVRRALLGRRVRLHVGTEPRDRYGRTLARVEAVDGPIAGRDLSEELARRGLARPLPIPPNTDDAPRIAALVDAARRAGAGLWTACGYTAAFPNAR
jgi:micrococcal nuclease